MRKLLGVLCLEIIKSATLVNVVHSANAGFELYDDERDNEIPPKNMMEASDFIVDIREYDVPYHVRVAIDKGNEPEAL